MSCLFYMEVNEGIQLDIITVLLTFIIKEIN